MNIALWIAQVLLLAMFGMAGAMKAFMTAKAKETQSWAKERTDGFVRFVGVAELLGALGMVLPMLTGILPWLTALAAVGLALIQILAIITVHVPTKEYKILPVNIILLALALFVVWGRWGLFVV
jgi:uncharacterized membrane protein YphA (DoxX/SURF4 family)